MNYKELEIDDYVLYRIPKGEKNVIHKVNRIGIDPLKGINMINGFHAVEYLPIGITPTMLTSNNIHLHTIGSCYKFYTIELNNENYIHIYKFNDKDYYTVSIYYDSDSIISTNCKYVHEFQHLLRISNLDVLIDFKVDDSMLN